VNKSTSFNFDEKKKDWGEEVSTIDQVSLIFINFLRGKLKKYPFSEGTI